MASNKKSYTYLNIFGNNIPFRQKKATKMPPIKHRKKLLNSGSSYEHKNHRKEIENFLRCSEKKIETILSKEVLDKREETGESQKIVFTQKYKENSNGIEKNKDISIKNENAKNHEDNNKVVLNIQMKPETSFKTEHSEIKQKLKPLFNKIYFPMNKSKNDLKHESSEPLSRVKNNKKNEKRTEKQLVYSIKNRCKRKNYTEENEELYVSHPSDSSKMDIKELWRKETPKDSELLAVSDTSIAIESKDFNYDQFGLRNYLQLKQIIENEVYTISNKYKNRGDEKELRNLEVNTELIKTSKTSFSAKKNLTAEEKSVEAINTLNSTKSISTDKPKIGEKSYDVTYTLNSTNSQIQTNTLAKNSKTNNTKREKRSTSNKTTHLRSLKNINSIYYRDTNNKDEKRNQQFEFLYKNHSRNEVLITKSKPITRENIINKQPNEISSRTTQNKEPSKIVENWSILHRLERAFEALGVPNFL